MPVTKTAKRALRASIRKEGVNKAIISRLEVAARVAKKTKTQANLIKAISLADRAAKKKVIHKNKAARIKSSLSKLLPQKKSAKSKSTKSSKVLKASARKK